MTARVTLLTGATGALGTVVAQHLSAAGHVVVAIDRHGQPPLAQLEAEHGPLTGAVLMAGAWQGGGPLHARADDRVWRAMLDANLETVYRTLRAVLPGMVARGAGSVVVVGARLAARPETGAGAAEYTASKAAAVALVQAVAAEVLSSGVRVNAILPSNIDTPANRAAMPSADPSRWVAPESLAGVIAFLLSDEARDISGAALPVYGRS